MEGRKDVLKQRAPFGLPSMPAGAGSSKYGLGTHGSLSPSACPPPPCCRTPEAVAAVENVDQIVSILANAQSTNP